MANSIACLESDIGLGVGQDGDGDPPGEEADPYTLLLEVEVSLSSAGSVRPALSDPDLGTAQGMVHTIALDLDALTVVAVVRPGALPRGDDGGDGRTR